MKTTEITQQAIKEACEAVGGQNSLAEKLKVAPAFVYQWLRGIRPVPPKYCVKIETLTGVVRQRLRPDDYADYWPELAPSHA